MENSCRLYSKRPSPESPASAEADACTSTFHCSRRGAVMLRPNVNVLVPGTRVVDQDALTFVEESGFSELLQRSDAGAAFGRDEQSLGLRDRWDKRWRPAASSRIARRLRGPSSSCLRCDRVLSGSTDRTSLRLLFLPPRASHNR